MQRTADPEVLARFADVMAGHAAAIAVITLMADDRRPRGLAVTSLSSYSASPPSVMVAIDHASRTHDLLMAADAFGVNFLSGDQRAVADVFASRALDKFADLEWGMCDDVPRLQGARAFLCCRRAAVFEHGDHSILVGDVVAIDQDDACPPLVYFRRTTGWHLGSLTNGR